MKIISWLSVIFAGLAALLWAWSAVVNLPVVRATFDGIGEIETFSVALRKVSRLNMYAAGCAFASALLQAIVVYLTTTQ
ncbi:hypothetical protein HAP41_0000028970 [Bradyrhizobium barranii subsp. apii]|uniref:Uncharacterized protein n=1 Tax=Bradyrhizobium barranii subsp. apii TaxID=2819348 RepID=A0A8T5VDV1_9BRAD|nr:hypothetical protein [Bradyrhizobium barranii]UPT84394.1 hypothetical protein HAP41_0000028970 [Bradyrhizobium barranii subsp. apii]